MKRLVLGGLSALLASVAFVPVANAQVPTQPTMPSEPTVDEPDVGVDVGYENYESPFELVSSAYRGQLEQQGIPAYTQLEIAYRYNLVSADDVVRSAIEAGQLSPLALEDEGYMSATRLHMETLVGSGSN